MNLRLEFPALKHKEQWYKIISEFEITNEEIFPMSLKNDCTDYDKFLRITIDFHKNANVPKELVSASTYFLMGDTDKILGAINIRHSLNEYLRKVGGHIGYGIAPSERKNGYGTKMLTLALEKCKELNIKSVLVTCNRNNVGSEKVILNNGGELENMVIRDDGALIKRYWIGT